MSGFVPFSVIRILNGFNFDKKDLNLMGLTEWADKKRLAGTAENSTGTTEDRGRKAICDATQMPGLEGVRFLL